MRLVNRICGMLIADSAVMHRAHATPLRDREVIGFSI